MLEDVIHCFSKKVLVDIVVLDLVEVVVGKIVEVSEVLVSCQSENMYLTYSNTTICNLYVLVAYIYDKCQNIVFECIENIH